MKELKQINHYFLKYKFHFFGGILATIVAQFFSLVSPKLISKSIGAVEDYFKNNETDAQAIKSFLIENIFLNIPVIFVYGYF